MEEIVATARLSASQPLSAGGAAKPSEVFSIFTTLIGKHLLSIWHLPSAAEKRVSSRKQGFLLINFDLCLQCLPRGSNFENVRMSRCTQDAPHAPVLSKSREWCV